MSLSDQLKNPVVWMVSLLVIGVVITVLVLTIGKKQNKSCLEGTTWNDACKKCVINCPEGSTLSKDCSRCDCVDPYTLCGGVCCLPKNCNKDDKGNEICCSQYIIDSSGKRVCCPGNTFSTDHKTCSVRCGPDGSNMVCAAGESCVYIKNLTDADLSFWEQQQATNPGKVSVDKINKAAYMCKATDKDQCTFSLPQTVPTAINNYYPCFRIEDSDPSTSLGYCGSTPDCFSKHTTKGECNSAGCKWVDIIQSVVDDYPNKQKNTLSNFDAASNGMQSAGYYCGDEGPYVRIIACNQESGNCDWKSCWNQLSQPGVSSVYWDDKQKVCAAIMACNNSSSGLENNIICNGKGDPVSTCETAGQLVKNPGVIDPIRSSTGSPQTQFPNCASATCPVSTSGYTCNNGKIQTGQTRWIPTGKDDQLTCVQQFTSSGGYDTEEECYYKECQPQGSNKCCKSGWIQHSGRCLQDPDINPYKDNRHCGDSWYTEHQSTPYNLCYGGPGGSAWGGYDGGNPPENSKFVYCKIDTTTKPGSWSKWDNKKNVQGYHTVDDRISGVDTIHPSFQDDCVRSKS